MCSFALAMVNIAGARLILNLKAYAASRNPDDDLTWDPTHRPAATSPIAPRFRFPSDARGSPTSSEAEGCYPRTDAFDLEMYAIEREDQNIGARLH